MSRDRSMGAIPMPIPPMEGSISSVIDTMVSPWRRKWRSDPQIPHARMRTSIWPASGRGSSVSSTTSRPCRIMHARIAITPSSGGQIVAQRLGPGRPARGSTVALLTWRGVASVSLAPESSTPESSTPESSTPESSAPPSSASGAGTPGAAVPLRTHVPGSVRAGVECIGGRRVVVARSVSGHHRGALTRADGDTIANAGRVALEERLPLVVVLSSSGSEVSEGIDALHGWGGAAAAVAACSGSVPVLAAVTGAAISGPALLLGLADVTVMTPDAFAFVSGPDAVEGFTGMRVSLHDLGGAAVHARSSGLCALLAGDEADVDGLLAAVLDYLPDHADAEPPRIATDDPAARTTPE